VNEFLTLEGIPHETFKFHVGNRCALEWMFDQYQVNTHKSCGISCGSNRLDGPENIVRLLDQIIVVSLETVKVVSGLPTLNKTQTKL